LKIWFFLSHRFVPFPLCQHCYHVDKGDHHVDKGNPGIASEWLRLNLSKVCLNHNPVLFSFMTNSLCCNTSNTTCATVSKKLRTLREDPSSSCLLYASCCPFVWPLYCLSFEIRFWLSLWHIQIGTKWWVFIWDQRA
jgi:hypothetical protein